MAVWHDIIVEREQMSQQNKLSIGEKTKRQKNKKT